MNKAQIIVLCSLISIIVALFINGAYDLRGEEISEKQYREQSLQYLEDIKNELEIMNSNI